MGVLLLELLLLGTHLCCSFEFKLILQLKILFFEQHFLSYKMHVMRIVHLGLLLLLWLLLLIWVLLVVCLHRWLLLVVIVHLRSGILLGWH